MNIKLWIRWIVLALIGCAAAVYLGDFVLYRLRGAPQSTVTVYQYQSVPLKGNKVEFDYLGTSDVPCSVSLFSQEGRDACWQLRRHQNQWTGL